MPYYPGNSGSFGRVFQLIPTIPRVYFLEYPPSYYQVGDRLFYFYMLDHQTADLYADEVGDIGITYPIGFQEFHDLYMCYYYQEC